jgi:uncharacterized membrane protein
VRGQIFKYWNRIRSGFWFLPTVMASSAMLLATLSITFDEQLAQWLASHVGWTFTGGAEGASAVLGIIAGSMISIAGVVFSMTLVALSLASSQMGPRLLRTFMRDTSTQVVLGTFIATFLYCLLVVRSIRLDEEVAFVPHVSVALGVLLAIASVGVLIYFIHHLSVSIQANEIAARISKELASSIECLFPEHIGRAAGNRPAQSHAPDPVQAFDAESRLVSSDVDGYLQFIDGEALIALARKSDVVVHLERKPGNYVVAGFPLARIWPAGRATDRVADQLRALFVLGHQRTSDQDIEFGVKQLVEIAVRALSPGLNDPFTAITCVDRLGSLLCRLAVREVPSSYRYDDLQQLRVIAPAYTFPELTDAAFNQIRQHGRASVAVTLRILETIALVAGLARRAEDRNALLRQADMVVRSAREVLSDSEDLRAVEDAYRSIVRSEPR